MNFDFIYSFVKASGLRMFGGYLWRGIKELLGLFLQWMLVTWSVGLHMEYCVSFTSSFHKRNYLTFLAEITIVFLQLLELWNINYEYSKKHCFHKHSRSLIGPMLSMLPTMTVKMTVLINPVLYIVLNSQVSRSTRIICVITTFYH